MLVLTRKIGEVIVINDDIRVKVLSIDGNQVRLGIEAPDDVSIWRTEIVADDPVVVRRRNVRRRPMPAAAPWQTNGSFE